MLGSNDIIAFAASRDAAAAKSFYRDTLGLRLVSEDPFALAFDAHGTMLRVQIVQEVAKAKYTILGWAVPDIIATAKRLSRAGVTPQRYEGLDQDQFGIWSFPAGPEWRGLKTLTATSFP